jgi:hypothetical protein
MTPGSHTLTASATGFNPKTLSATVTAGQTTQNFNFSLTPTPGTVTGTVSASGGAAISGATVTDSGGATATTDLNGNYTLNGLPPGSHTLTAAASTYSSQTTTVTVSAGQTTPGVNFALVPAPVTGAVSGTVTNASGGTPIASATVTDSGGASTTTDANGIYTLSGLPTGTRSLTATAGGFTPQTLSATVTGGQTTPNVNFTLTSTTGAVTGTVTNIAGGTAIAGATVTDSGGASTTSNASGTYTLSGLVPGSHSLTASATGFTTSQPQAATVTAGQTTLGVNFSLAVAPGTVTGTVTSASGAAVIAGATVSDPGGASAVTNGSGVYTISGLVPGSHSLTASAASFNPVTSSATVTAGQTTQNFNFSLTPTPGSVTGTVTNASGGATLAGATVTDSGGTSATTNGSGVYTLSGLTPGSHTLTASATGFTTSQPQAATVTAAQTTANINFALTPVPTTGAVTGTVTSASGGTPIASATVSDSGGASTTANASGVYTLSGLPPGSRTLTASASGFTSQTLSATVTVGQTTQSVNFILPTIPRPQLVQSTGATETTAATSLTATFPTATGAGHLLVLSASVYAGPTSPITSVTDSGGNTWTNIGAFSVAGHNSDGEMWYTANAKAVTSVVINNTSAVVAAIAVQEFSGVATTSPLDVSAGTSNTSTSPSSGPVTPTASTDLVVGFVAGHNNAQAMSVTSTGYTTQAQQTSSGPPVASVITGYTVLTSASAQTFAGSFTSAMYWASGIATFRAGP